MGIWGRRQVRPDDGRAPQVIDLREALHAAGKSRPARPGHLAVPMPRGLPRASEQPLRLPASAPMTEPTPPEPTPPAAGADPVGQDDDQPHLSSYERLAWGDFNARLARARQDLGRIADERPFTLLPPAVPVAAAPTAAEPVAAEPVAPEPAAPLVDAPDSADAVEAMDDHPRRSATPWLLTALAAAAVGGAGYWAAGHAGGSMLVSKGSAASSATTTAPAVTSAPSATGSGPARSVAAAGPAAQADIGTSLAQAWAWLAASSASGARVLVPTDLLQAATTGLPGRAVVSNAGASAGPPQIVVAPADRFASVTAGLATRPVARFGAVEVAQVLPSPAAAAADREARVQAAVDLLANPAVTVTAPARVAMGSGTVDERLLVVIAGLSIDHQVSVDVGPADPGAVPGALLRTLVVAVDGDIGATTLTRFVNAQSPALVPQSVARAPGPGGVLSYTVPTPEGLLDGAGFPTVTS